MNPASGTSASGWAASGAAASGKKPASLISALERTDVGFDRYWDVFRHALAPGLPLLSWAWGIVFLLALLGFAITAWSPRRSDPGDERVLFAGVTLVLGIAGYAAYLAYISVVTQFWYYLPLLGVIALSAEVGVRALLARIPRAASLLPALAGVLLGQPVPTTIAPTGLTYSASRNLVLNKSRSDDKLVAAITVDFNGPDRDQFIQFEVYPDAATARASFDATTFTNSDKISVKGTPAFPAPAITTPSKCFNFVRIDLNYGGTECHTVVDNVVIVGVHRLANSQTGGTLSVAASLTRSGIAYYNQTVGK